jgi:hypothetical protein
MPNQTDKALAQIRTELLTTFSAADRESYSHLVGWLRDTDVASHALKLGELAPDFLLPCADGRLHSSEQLRRNGPLVLSFFRGGCIAGLGMRVLKALAGQLGGELRMASNFVRPGRLRHSDVAQRSIALCNPFPIVILRRPRRAIASSHRDNVAGRGTGNDDGDLERRDDRGVG